MGHIHKSRFNIRKGTVGRPDPLAEVNFKPSDNSRKEANENSRQHDVAFGVLHVFRERSYPVEAYIGQGGVRGSHPDQTSIEGPGIVKRLNRKDSVPTFEVKQITDGQHDEDGDHCAHDDYENDVGISRSSYSA